MKNLLKSFLYHFDLFKSPIFLLFNSKVKIPSNFSCFVSMILLGFLVFYFSQSDLFARQNPISSAQYISTQARPKLDFDSHNMDFAFGITDGNNVFYMNSTIFTISIENLFRYSSTGEIFAGDSKTVQNCKESDFHDHIDKFHELGLKSAFCAENSNFSIEGYWDEKIVKYIQVVVWPCNNLTSNNSCRPREEINAFMMDKYLNIFYTDTIIDVNNYKSPIQNSYKTLYFALDSVMVKKMTLNFKKVVLRSDEGLIFQEDTHTESFMFGSRELETMSNNGDCFGSYVIYSSSETYVITRRYQKLQEAIANLGGLANSLLWFGYLITSIEKEFIVFAMIMNRLYIFSEEKKKKTLTLLKNTSIESKPPDERNCNQNEVKGEENKPKITLCEAVFIKPIIPPNDIFLEHFSEMDEKYIPKAKTKISRLKTFFTREKNKKQELYMSFIEFCKVKFSFSWMKLNKREKLTKEALRIFRKEIDIVELIQKLHDIDKLKLLLLDPMQCQLFNLIAKPLLHLNDVRKNEYRMSNNMKMMMKLQNSKENISLEKVQEYYKKVKNQGSKANALDQRLANMIDVNIINDISCQI